MNSSSGMCECAGLPRGMHAVPFLCFPSSNFRLPAIAFEAKVGLPHPALPGFLDHADLVHQSGYGFSLYLTFLIKVYTDAGVQDTHDLSGNFKRLL